MREELPKIYSQDLLNNLFRHPYTKIDFVMKELQMNRNNCNEIFGRISTNRIAFQTQKMEGKLLSQ